MTLASDVHSELCCCRAHPLPAALIVRDARDRYLSENGFTLSGYDARWTPASLFGIPFAVPNTQAHRRGIMLHDLHHVATGYGTDLVGEGEISAWEARGPLAPAGAYVISLVASGAAAGYLLAPRRARAAARVSAGRNLFAVSLDDYEGLLKLTVGELRSSLGLAARGLAEFPRRLHSRAPRS